MNQLQIIRRILGLTEGHIATVQGNFGNITIRGNGTSYINGDGHGDGDEYGKDGGCGYGNGSNFRQGNGAGDFIEPSSIGRL